MRVFNYFRRRKFSAPPQPYAKTGKSGEKNLALNWNVDYLCNGCANTGLPPDFFSYKSFKVSKMNNKHKKSVCVMLMSNEHKDQKMFLNFFPHIIQHEVVQTE